MLSVTQTTGYAILALSCLDKSGEEWVLEKDIAEKTGISKPYLSKLLYRLTKGGLIVSKRGYKGGISLSRPANEITMLDIFEAVEGTDWRDRCLLGLPGCSSNQPCPMHKFWLKMRPKIEDQFKNLTLAEVMEFRKTGWRLRTETYSIQFEKETI